MSEKLLPQSNVTVTPTLTNAQKYSSEFGFEPGVVVEIFTHDGDHSVEFFNYIGQDYLTCTNFYYAKGPDDDYDENFHPILYEFNEIKSIRILSGPWSCWQFAPSDAVACYVAAGDAPIAFLSKLNGWTVDQAKEVYGHYFVMPAPWWWLEGQK